MRGITDLNEWERYGVTPNFSSDVSDESDVVDPHLLQFTKRDAKRKILQALDTGTPGVIPIKCNTGIVNAIKGHEEIMVSPESRQMVLINPIYYGQLRDLNEAGGK